jgi:uncharacterized protein YegL
MRTIKFSAGAEWVDNEFILLKNYQWRPLETTLGETDLGEALSQVADAVRFKKDGGLMPETRTRQPHLILVTDGYPTDEWESGLKKLMSTYWGGNAVRMAVALGDAADDDDTMDVLRQFVGNVRDADIRICSSDRIDESFFTNGLVILS